jgi:hypothetical protein
MKLVLYADAIRMFRHGNNFLESCFYASFPVIARCSWEFRLLGYGAWSLGNQILKFRSSAVSSISRETSTREEKGITSYRNVGISLTIYAASYPRRYPELFLHRRHLLLGDVGLGSCIWRSLAALHTTVSSLLAKNVINFYSCRPMVPNLRSRPKLGSRGVCRKSSRFQGVLNSYKKNCLYIQKELLRFVSCMFCVFGIVLKNVGFDK